MEKLVDVPIKNISISKNHIRVQSVDKKSIKELADSILFAGLLVRVIVRPVGKDRYELVDGERRLSAFKSLFEARGEKWARIPAIVEEMNVKEAVRRQVVINELREDLTPFEKAKGYKMAWETGHFRSYRELASMVGRDHADVTRSINIFERFPKEIIDGFESGKLRQAHLKNFYRLPDRQAMRKLYNAIVKGKMNSDQARELANRLDEKWLPGDRELLREVAEKDPEIGALLGTEITIADLVNKSKCTLVYSNLARFKELVLNLARLVKSGGFSTTMSQQAAKQ